jgi:hypothetical protein
MPHLYGKARSGQCTRSSIDGEQVALLHAVKSVGWVRWREIRIADFVLRDVNLHGARRIFVRRIAHPRIAMNISFLGHVQGGEEPDNAHAQGMSTRAIAEAQGTSEATVRRGLSGASGDAPDNRARMRKG